MKTFNALVAVVVPLTAVLTACSHEPAPEVLRPVRTVEIRYGEAREAHRYVGTVQSRHEVDQAFRVGGKVVERRVDVGDVVSEGQVLAVLDDNDYRLAVHAAEQQLTAAVANARQAESDRKRLEDLKADGSVSVADDEHAQSVAQTTRAAAEAQARQLELARNQLQYTVLRAPRSGVITALRFEVGQVVAAGQPVVSLANEEEPEIVIDVPEDHVAAFKQAHYRAWLASAPDEKFEVSLRELAALPASSITQSKGQPALWVVRRSKADAAATVELVPVDVHAYRNDEVLVSGPRAGELVVVAGVHKMAPGLRVALAGAAELSTDTRQAAR
ncbi:MAG: efflux transporter, family, subunit [Steroidobacteraceae bacterium]|nr:efflux transporter, family, subunit [Steroidobacteraceae bacterium]